jgi:hypothetical protein
MGRLCQFDHPEDDLVPETRGLFQRGGKTRCSSQPIDAPQIFQIPLINGNSL